MFLRKQERDQGAFKEIPLVEESPHHWVTEVIIPDELSEILDVGFTLVALYEDVEAFDGFELSNFLDAEEEFTGDEVFVDLFFPDVFDV